MFAELREPHLVEVVAARLPPDADFKRALELAFSVLSAEDVARIRKKLRPVDQVRGVLATLLLHRVAFGGPHCSRTLARTPLGRPVIPCGKRVQDANASHHGQWVVCAASALTPCRVGIDILSLTDTPARESLGDFRRSFSTREHSLLKSAPTSVASSELFAALWTVKEAIAKAVGCGLRADFSQLDVLGSGVCTAPTLWSGPGTATDTASEGQASLEPLWQPTVDVSRLDAAGAGIEAFCPPLPPTTRALIWCVSLACGAEKRPALTCSQCRRIAVFRPDTEHIAAVATVRAICSQGDGDVGRHDPRAVCCDVRYRWGLVPLEDLCLPLSAGE